MTGPQLLIKERKMKELFGTSLAVIGIVIGVLFLLTLPTMWLWNYVMPTIFSLPEISVLQALALLFLAQIFFKNSSSNSK